MAFQPTKIRFTVLDAVSVATSHVVVASSGYTQNGCIGMTSAGEFGWPHTFTPAEITPVYSGSSGFVSHEGGALLVFKGNCPANTSVTFDIPDVASPDELLKFNVSATWDSYVCGGARLLIEVLAVDRGAEYVAYSYQINYSSSPEYYTWKLFPPLPDDYTDANGMSWVYSRAPKALGISIHIAGKIAGTWFGCIRTGSGTRGSFFSSTDLSSWVPILEGVYARTSDFQVFTGTGWLVLATQSVMYRTEDGVTWELLSPPASAFYSSRQAGETLITMSGAQSSFSNDGGRTWSTVASNLGALTRNFYASDTFRVWKLGTYYYFIISANQNKFYRSTDLATWELVGTLPLPQYGDFPQYVSVNPEGTRAYISTNYSISYIDSSGAVTDLYTGSYGGYQGGAIYFLSDKKVIVASFGSSRYSYIDEVSGVCTPTDITFPYFDNDLNLPPNVVGGKVFIEGQHILLTSTPAGAAPPNTPQFFMSFAKSYEVRGYKQ